MILLFFIQRVLSSMQTASIITQFTTLDPFCESNIIYPDARSNTCEGRSFQHGKSCSAQCLERVTMTCDCMDILFNTILIAKPGGCVWEIEGICEVPVVKKTASAIVEALFPSNTTAAECENKMLNAIESSSSKASANVTCTQAQLRKRRSLNSSPTVTFFIDIELSVTQVVDISENNTDTDISSTTTDDSDSQENFSSNTTNTNTSEQEILSILIEASETISESTKNETGVDPNDILDAPTKINITRIEIEEVVEEATPAEEESNISQFKDTIFTPQTCNTTLQDDTYRVIYEKKIFLSSTGIVDDIIDAFETDLIDDHSLCVEFNDIYDVLYITVDSAPQEGNFYIEGVEIEQKVEQEIDQIVESLALSGTVVYPDFNKTLVLMLFAEGITFDVSVNIEFENDWTWSSELLDKTSSSYALLTSVIYNIFSLSWDTIATENNLDLDVQIKYSKNQVNRRRRSATASTTVTITLDYTTSANNTDINSPLDLQSLEVSIMADLTEALETDSEQNDATNFLSSNFQPSMNCEVTVTFDSEEDQEESTTIAPPTTVQVNTMDSERISDLEEAVEDMEESLKNLSLMDIELAGDISDLSGEISNVENSVSKKSKEDRFMEMMILQSLFKKTPSTSADMDNRLRKMEADSKSSQDQLESRLLDIINGLAIEIRDMKSDIFSAFGIE